MDSIRPFLSEVRWTEYQTRPEMERLIDTISNHLTNAQMHNIPRYLQNLKPISLMRLQVSNASYRWQDLPEIRRTDTICDDVTVGRFLFLADNHFLLASVFMQEKQLSSVAM